MVVVIDKFWCFGGPGNGQYYCLTTEGASAFW